MSARALEFVEEWVSEKIEQGGFPAEGEASPAKAWASECLGAAMQEGIPSGEVNEAFDDLAAFIDGEIEEARNRAADRSDEEDSEELVEDDDARLIDEEEDEAEEDK